jgi:hypothetical protein
MMGPSTVQRLCLGLVELAWSCMIDVMAQESISRAIAS